ncbi:hypothetical protein HID58_014689 [Brassica napus]|uniref:SGS domain-containing protein n=1 Tax=Brassica napus TaxID=3708 RepID=A0ABQ8DHU5_BRANA|nr:hypothetical protein HID58_014689 [Brassica napus]
MKILHNQKVESNGTVLSIDWKDVGAKKIESTLQDDLVISQLYYLGGKYKGDLFCHSGGDRGFVLTVDGGKDRCIIKEKEIKILKLNVKTLDKAGISTAS